MLVAQRSGSPVPTQANSAAQVQPLDVVPPPIGAELQTAGTDAELAADNLRITQDDLKALLVRDAVLVLDIGDQEAYEDGHLPGAILVPLGALPARVDALRAAKKALVAYCR